MFQQQQKTYCPYCNRKRPHKDKKQKERCRYNFKKQKKQEQGEEQQKQKKQKKIKKKFKQMISTIDSIEKRQQFVDLLQIQKQPQQYVIYQVDENIKLKTMSKFRKIHDMLYKIEVPLKKRRNVLFYNRYYKYNPNHEQEVKIIPCILSLIEDLKIDYWNNIFEIQERNSYKSRMVSQNQLKLHGIIVKMITDALKSKDIEGTVMYYQFPKIQLQQKKPNIICKNKYRFEQQQRKNINIFESKIKEKTCQLQKKREELKLYPHSSEKYFWQILLDEKSIQIEFQENNKRRSEIIGQIHHIQQEMSLIKQELQQYIKSSQKKKNFISHYFENKQKLQQITDIDERIRIQQQNSIILKYRYNLILLNECDMNMLTQFHEDNLQKERLQYFQSKQNSITRTRNGQYKKEKTIIDNKKKYELRFLDIEDEDEAEDKINNLNLLRKFLKLKEERQQLRFKCELNMRIYKKLKRQRYNQRVQPFFNYDLARELGFRYAQSKQIKGIQARVLKFWPLSKIIFTQKAFRELKDGVFRNQSDFSSYKLKNIYKKKSQNLSFTQFKRQNSKKMDQDSEQMYFTVNYKEPKKSDKEFKGDISEQNIQKSSDSSQYIKFKYLEPKFKTKQILKMYPTEKPKINKIIDELKKKLNEKEIEIFIRLYYNNDNRLLTNMKRLRGSVGFYQFQKQANHLGKNNTLLDAKSSMNKEQYLKLYRVYQSFSQQIKQQSPERKTANYYSNESERNKVNFQNRILQKINQINELQFKYQNKDIIQQQIESQFSQTPFSVNYERLDENYEGFKQTLDKPIRESSQKQLWKIFEQVQSKKSEINQNKLEKIFEDLPNKDDVEWRQKYIKPNFNPHDINFEKQFSPIRQILFQDEENDIIQINKRNILTEYNHVPKFNVDEFKYDKIVFTEPNYSTEQQKQFFKIQINKFLSAKNLKEQSFLFRKNLFRKEFEYDRKYDFKGRRRLNEKNCKIMDKYQNLQYVIPIKYQYINERFGSGLCSSRKIKKFQFMGWFNGVILTRQEGKQNGDEHNMLDYVSTKEKNWVISFPEGIWSIGPMFNHAPMQNLKSKKIKNFCNLGCVGIMSDKGLQYCFYALRDIDQGEHLTWDYNSGSGQYFNEGKNQVVDIYQVIKEIRREREIKQRNGSEQNHCCICFSQFQKGQQIVGCYCAIKTHRTCIENWQALSSGNYYNCPMCRKKYEKTIKNEHLIISESDRDVIYNRVRYTCKICEQIVLLSQKWIKCNNCHLMVHQECFNIIGSLKCLFCHGNLRNK